jgi:hypothetical protein
MDRHRYEIQDICALFFGGAAFLLEGLGGMSERCGGRSTVVYASRRRRRGAGGENTRRALRGRTHVKKIRRTENMKPGHSPRVLGKKERGKKGGYETRSFFGSKEAEFLIHRVDFAVSKYGRWGPGHLVPALDAPCHAIAVQCYRRRYRVGISQFKHCERLTGCICWHSSHWVEEQGKLVFGVLSSTTPVPPTG